MPSLKKLSRADLNKKAHEAGVRDPEQLDKRADVVEAIEAAQEAPPPTSNPFGPSARVVSVFGPKHTRALIELPAELAEQMFGRLDESPRSEVVEAVQRDLAEIAERDKELSESGLAAVAVRLALELDHPYNSATSKGQCAKTLNETLDRLRELAPEKEESDGVDDLAARRRARLKGGAATAN